MKISIVMPSYNQASFLQQAIDSVLDQAGSMDLQLIVVDGGSTDHSVQILSKYDDPRLTWSSSPDRGQSDAINKGMALASGDILAWLNSDDYYRAGALQAVANAFEQDPDRAWLTGRCSIVNKTGEPIRRMVTRYKDRRLARYRRGTLLRENYISQPATFWRRWAWEAVGPLDTDLNWAMDYDLWLRLSRLSDPILVDREIACFRLHSTSKTGNFQRAQYDEGYRVACRHAPKGSVNLLMHRLNVEKIVLAYRAARLLGV